MQLESTEMLYPDYAPLNFDVYTEVQNKIRLKTAVTIY